VANFRAEEFLIQRGRGSRGLQRASGIQVNYQLAMAGLCASRPGPEMAAAGFAAGRHPAPPPPPAKTALVPSAPAPGWGSPWQPAASRPLPFAALGKRGGPQNGPKKQTRSAAAGQNELIKLFDYYRGKPARMSGRGKTTETLRMGQLTDSLQ
jgi:hypothetical protein